MITVVVGFLLMEATILSALFCGYYAFRSRWRATAPGRSLMYLNLSLAGLGVNEVAGHFLTDGFPGHEPIRAVLLVALVIALVRQLSVLFDAQRKQR